MVLTVKNDMYNYKYSTNRRKNIQTNASNQTYVKTYRQMYPILKAIEISQKF